MTGKSKPAKNVTAYIAAAPRQSQPLLKQLRRIVRQSAPKAEEVISYGMPLYKYHGMLVSFAGYQHHIGFYAMGYSTRKKFAKELTSYKTSAGTVQFPLDRPLPVSLVKKIVKFRMQENEARTKAKKKNNL